MKQKIVIKVSMSSPKLRTKAMRIVVSVPGVISAEIQGDDKNQIVVTGDGIDSTCLTMLIRKKVGFTELVSVTPITGKKEEEKKDVKSYVQPVIFQYDTPQIYRYATPQTQWSEVQEFHQDPCTIM